MRWVCEECGDASQGEGTCGRDGTAYAPASDPLLGQRIGSWQLTRLIGSGGVCRAHLAGASAGRLVGAGGCGGVSRAVQPAIGARVAVKVLARDCLDDPDAVSRFMQEA